MVDIDKDLETAAKQCAGNWRQFDSFGWSHASDEDSRDWAIFGIATRDSKCREQSNAVAIVKVLEAADPKREDWRTEHHGHWACGWVDNVVIRTMRDGNVTAAFKAYHECMMALSDYPVLDDADCSERESEALHASVLDAVKTWARRQDHDVTTEEIDRIVDQVCQDANETDEDYYPDDREIEDAAEACGAAHKNWCDGCTECAPKLTVLVEDSEDDPFSAIVSVRAEDDDACERWLALNGGSIDGSSWEGPEDGFAYTIVGLYVGCYAAWEKEGYELDLSGAPDEDPFDMFYGMTDEEMTEAFKEYTAIGLHEDKDWQEQIRNKVRERKDGDQ